MKLNFNKPAWTLYGIPLSHSTFKAFNKSAHSEVRFFSCALNFLITFDILWKSDLDPRSLIIWLKSTP